jgi:hypothetical protein
MKKGELYFTQEIDEQVLIYVRENPILSGVREGNLILTTKIPYMTKRYLNENDPRIKRYYYCHCPWVRESIRTGRPKIPTIFCNCSTGFTKFYFDAVFDDDVRCDVLETVLGGDTACKFAIHIPKDWEKRKAEQENG